MVSLSVIKKSISVDQYICIYLKKKIFFVLFNCFISSKSTLLGWQIMKTLGLNAFMKYFQSWAIEIIFSGAGLPWLAERDDVMARMVLWSLLLFNEAVISHASCVSVLWQKASVSVSDASASSEHLRNLSFYVILRLV